MNVVAGVAAILVTVVLTPSASRHLALVTLPAPVVTVVAVVLFSRWFRHVP